MRICVSVPEATCQPCQQCAEAWDREVSGSRHGLGFRIQVGGAVCLSAPNPTCQSCLAPQAQERHCHHTRREEPALTSSAVSGLFRCGCHCSASSGFARASFGFPALVLL